MCAARFTVPQPEGRLCPRFPYQTPCAFQFALPYKTQWSSGQNLEKLGVPEFYFPQRFFSQKIVQIKYFKRSNEKGSREQHALVIITEHNRQGSTGVSEPPVPCSAVPQRKLLDRCPPGPGRPCLGRASSPGRHSTAPQSGWCRGTRINTLEAGSLCHTWACSSHLYVHGEQSLKYSSF